MRLKVQQFLSDETGATAIEYGLIAAGMGVAMITLMGHAGDEIRVMVEHLRGLLRSFNLNIPTS